MKDETFHKKTMKLQALELKGCQLRDRLKKTEREWARLYNDLYCRPQWPDYCRQYNHVEKYSFEEATTDKF